MENKKNNLWKLIQLAGLAFSIPFELAAGPFVGYFIGLYLRDKFGAPHYVMHAVILMGIIASIYNTSETIKAMVKMNKEK